METIILSFIQKVENASKNVRYIVVLLSMASIMSFICLWNSWESNWHEGRIQFYHNQIKWLRCFENQASEDSLKIVNKNSPEVIEKYYAIKDYYLNHRYGADVLRELLVYLKVMAFENYYLVKAPILGVSFDINNFGLISGLAFIIGLFVLLYSIILKYNQIKNAFEIIDESNDKEKKNYFRLLLSVQVLSVDRYKVGTIATGRLKRTWLGKINLRYAPLFLYAPPALIHTFIFLNDVRTFSQGEMIDSSYSEVICVVSGLLLLAISVLTMLIYKNLSKVHNLWNEIFDYYKTQIDLRK